MLLSRTLDVIGAVWIDAALGTGLLVVGTGAGWVAGQAGWLPPVRLIAMWVRRFVLPLLRCQSWWRRATAIFVNNVSILAALLALGQWHGASLAGVAGLGLSLGIGLRILSGESDAFGEMELGSNARASRCIRIGVFLNLLEPPAIILTIGLSLARATVPLPDQQVWETFALWVVPLTLLAAAGEALWMGAGQGAYKDTCMEQNSDRPNPDRSPQSTQRPQRGDTKA